MDYQDMFYHGNQCKSQNTSEDNGIKNRQTIAAPAGRDK